MFGKINVELGPKIGKVVDLLKQLEFPKVGIVEKTSPIDDGGQEAIKDHQEQLKNKEKLDEENKKATNKQNLKYFDGKIKNNILENTINHKFLSDMPLKEAEY